MGLNERKLSQLIYKQKLQISKKQKIEKHTQKIKKLNKIRLRIGYTRIRASIFFKVFLIFLSVFCQFLYDELCIYPLFNVISKTNVIPMPTEYMHEKCYFGCRFIFLNLLLIILQKYYLILVLFLLRLERLVYMGKTVQFRA